MSWMAAVTTCVLEAKSRTVCLELRDVAKIDKTLSHVKPQLVDEILATVNEP